MSDDRVPYGDPETFDTPVTLTLRLSARERSLLAMLLDGTPPALGCRPRQPTRLSNGSSA